MNFTRDRVRSIGWVVVLTVCFGLLVALTLRVNAEKARVHSAEKQIVALKQDIRRLETEFKTRANQHQLRTLNQLEFGYAAPGAGQYLEGERALASLGQPRAPNAPAPIRLAAAPPLGERRPGGIVAMVSPVAAATPARETAATAASAAPAKAQVRVPYEAGASADPVASAIASSGDLGERLSRLERADGGGQ